MKEIVDLTKEYLSDSKLTIKLHDLVVQFVKEVLLHVSEDNFKVQGEEWGIEEFLERLKRYETIIKELQCVISCVAYWGKQEHDPILRKAIARVTDRLDPQSGLVVWSALRWYPVILLLYSSGISALAGERYENLASLFLTRAGTTGAEKHGAELITAVGEAAEELQGTDVFRHVPGHERNYLPQSEYLFERLQPTLDDLLFLGRDYERLFDRFEVLFALVYADLLNQQEHGVRGPLGRFAWKYRNRSGAENPLKDILAEAHRQGAAWSPVKVGLFGGDFNRFKQVGEEYEKLIASRHWW